LFEQEFPWLAKGSAPLTSRSGSIGALDPGLIAVGPFDGESFLVQPAPTARAMPLRQGKDSPSNGPDRDEAGVKSADTSPTRCQGRRSFRQHGTLLEQGKADMYNPANGANYCRAGATGVGSRQIGRRAIVLMRRSWCDQISPCTPPQQLAGRTVECRSMPARTTLALHLLEGFLPRDQINVCARPMAHANRFNLHDEG